MNRVALSLCVAAAALPFFVIRAGAAGSGPTVQVLLQDGRTVEGTPRQSSIEFEVGGVVRKVALKDVLSWHSAAPATADEVGRITAGLADVIKPDLTERQAAAESLVSIGLPVLTPLLDSYKDTDIREPAVHYRIFSRLIAGYADELDRSLDALRLKNGSTLRGKLKTASLSLRPTNSRETQELSSGSLRRLAVLQQQVSRDCEVHTLRHCTYIDWLDTGIAVTAASSIRETAQGYARLSFGIDGWSSDPDGLKKPGPRYRTNLVDGFPFGALIARIGVRGKRFLAGKASETAATESGRLYFAVNDNPHWQNNIGSYRMRLTVTHAYDLGDAQ